MKIFMNCRIEAKNKDEFNEVRPHTLQVMQRLQAGNMAEMPG